MWRQQWPKHTQDSLGTTNNPIDTITNYKLELSGGLLHLQAIYQDYDARERTLLSKTVNLTTLFRQHKGSATTNKCPHYLLILFGIHQRYHRYVPHHDYFSGPSNAIADDSSRLFHLSNKQFLQYMSSNYKHPKHYHLLTINPAVISAVTSALLMNLSNPASLLVPPTPPQQTGNNGKHIVMTWHWIPFSEPLKTKYQSYKSLPNEIEKERL